MEQIRQTFDPVTDVARLVEHPRNPRKGNDNAVAASIDEFGFYGAVVAQVSTGYVLAGNTRLRVARQTGSETIPVVWVDVDDETATRILLADNRTSDLATYDGEVLYQLLADLSRNDLLDGTGYTPEVIERLLQDVAIDSDGFVNETPRPDEILATYEAADIRSVILPFPRDQYVTVVEMMTRVRQNAGFDTNAEVVLHVLQHYLDD